MSDDIGLVEDGIIRPWDVPTADHIAAWQAMRAQYGRRVIRWLGRGLTDSVKAGLYEEERDQLWYQWKKGVQVAFRYWEEW